MATIHIPTLSEIHARDGSALSSATAELHEALIVWGAMMAADLFAKHPCVGALAFTSKGKGPGGRAHIDPSNAAELSTDALADLYEAVALGRAGARRWPPGFIDGYKAACAEVRSWDDDPRFAPLLLAAAKVDNPLAIERGDETSLQRRILEGVSLGDLWAKLEASHVAESTPPSFASSGGARI